MFQSWLRVFGNNLATENDVNGRMLYEMFFIGRNFVSCLLCTIKHTKQKSENPVLLSWRKVLVLEDPRGPIFKSLSSSSSSSSKVQVLENFRGKCWGSCDVTSVWLVLWQLCISTRPGLLFETRCLQCCCPRGPIFKPSSSSSSLDIKSLSLSLKLDSLFLSSSLSLKSLTTTLWKP